MSLPRFLRGTRPNPPLRLTDAVVEGAIQKTPDFFARGDIPQPYALVYEQSGPRAVGFVAGSAQELAGMVADERRRCLGAEGALSYHFVREQAGPALLLLIERAGRPPEAVLWAIRPEGGRPRLGPARRETPQPALLDAIALLPGRAPVPPPQGSPLDVN